MKKNPALSVIFLFILIAFLNISPAYPADNSSPIKVTDISDRKYEEALLKSEGKDLSSISKAGLTTRFNVNKVTIHEAFSDLEKISGRK